MDSIILGLLSGLWAIIALTGLSVWCHEQGFLPLEPPDPPEQDLEAQLIATGFESKLWPRPVERPRRPDRE